MRMLTVDQDKCVGCVICSLACVYAHEQAFNPAYGRIWVVRKQPSTDYPVVCKQCAKPQCVKACPNNAITKRKDGLVVVNEKLCTGCGECVKACPFKGIKLHRVKHVAIKCDLCDGREPQCVKFCPTKALKLQATTASRRKGR